MAAQGSVRADPDAVLYGLSRAHAPRTAARPSLSAAVVRRRVVAQPVQLVRDRFRGLGAQEGTAVEPDSFSRGSTVVAAYQVGRFVDGGALAIGYSTSKDAGRTWRSGLLPSLSRAAKPSGDAELVADSSVAFDAKHGYWLIVSLAAFRSSDAIVVSRSRDGLAWQAPITAVRGDGLDKSWIGCDNWSASPHRGNCYLTYLDGSLDAIVMRTSKDGAQTWSRSVVVAYGTASNQSINGAQPLVRPNGTVIVAFTSIAPVPSPGRHRIAVVRSTDGGATFSAQQGAAFIEANGFGLYGIRTPKFPSGDVDAGGTAYLVWHDCPAYECEDVEILFSRSQDGVSWSRAEPLPTKLGEDAFLPALAVAPGTKGAHARLAVTYYSVRCAGLLVCTLDANLDRSSDGGLTWQGPERLNPKTMRLDWLAQTNLGFMLGDYISTSFAAGRPIPVFALASAPGGGHFNEAIFASRLPA